MEDQVQSFKDRYTEDTRKLTTDIYTELQNCLNIIGLNPNYYINPLNFNLKQYLDDLKNLSTVETHLQRFSYYKGYFENTVKGKVDTDEKENVVNETVSKITEIIDYMSKQKTEFYKMIDVQIEKIKNCPYGIKIKRTKNALNFQRFISQLFYLLFIDELYPLNLQKLENPKKQRRDAAFRVLDAFNTEGRCGYKFNNLFIECKNYENPSHKDVMQVFSYTIFYNASNIFKIPLSLIVSRKNPEDNSYAMDYRDKIYHKRIAENETRVILFFDVKDLEEMADIKTKNRDPAFTIKRKIEEFNDRYIGVFGG